MMFNFTQRHVWLFITAFTWIAVVISVILTQVFNLDPCPLCIIQRLIFILMGCLAIITALFWKYFAGRILGIFTWITGLCGVAIAVYQSWLQWQPPGSTACVATQFGSFGQMLDWLGQLWPALFLATGFCEDPGLRILGFSFANWAVLGFIFCSAIAAWMLIRPTRKLITKMDLLIKNYFLNHKVRKLHIGCGQNILDNWLNADVTPSSEFVLYLDATQRFPFEDNTFDYIFSEHMIEHITYSNGLKMLIECQRVLKKHGKIRISTPDLQFLINLYQYNKSELQIKYIQWATDNFIKDAPYPDDIFVINNFVRDWGHLFIYDLKTLRGSLETVGFKNIIQCELNKSNEIELKNLENKTRIPLDFLKLESFTLEATKE